METKKSELKIVVAEFTLREHKELMELLVRYLTHNQEELTIIKYTPIPVCTCGECKPGEKEKERDELVASMSRGVDLLQSITDKLK